MSPISLRAKLPKLAALLDEAEVDVLDELQKEPVTDTAAAKKGRPIRNPYPVKRMQAAYRLYWRLRPTAKDGPRVSSLRARCRACGSSNRCLQASAPGE
jgi:hypothetical protein